MNVFNENITSLFWLNYIWQFPKPFIAHLNSEFYFQYTIITPHQYRGTAKQMTNTNNFMAHKILPIDNATLFLSRFNYFRSHSEIEFNLWSLCIWIPKKISKLHITMKSLLGHSTLQLSNRKRSFQEMADLCRRFSFLWKQFISAPGEQLKIKLSLKIFPVALFHREKFWEHSSPETHRGSAEHLQQNLECLPPQHPENSPITNWLEENTFPPIQSALRFVCCDVISKILQLCWSFSSPQRLNARNAPSRDCLSPGHCWLLLITSTPPAGYPRNWDRKQTLFHRRLEVNGVFD